jgi:peptidoglycan hydrolase-like protein with peptidoglycan-binding domain
LEAEFRSYGSFNDSIEDHNKLISLGRYKPVRECEDYREACLKIYECGYATDPAYPEKLIRIIEENKLYEFDRMSGTSGQDKTRRFQVLCNELGIKDNEGKPLVEDNTLGAKTLSCIERMPLLKLGSRGKAVEFIQHCINTLIVDGAFGPVTRQGIMEYQKANHIGIDGIVGFKTWTSLITK